MGSLYPEKGDGEIQVEFEFTAAPPDLRSSVYFTDHYRIRALYSQRFDFKARAHEEDLESRPIGPPLIKRDTSAMRSL